MRILVTGGSGLLGHKIVGELCRGGNEVYALHYKHDIPVDCERLVKVKLDLSSNVDVEDLILKVKPEVVVHCAAYTHVDGCEVNREYAWRINVEATRSIVHASRIVKSYLIFISTDYVFDGEKGLYSEDDIPNPISYYGLTKLIGEEIVKSSNLPYTIVRPSAIYGVGVERLNFATFVIERLRRNEPVKALTDQYVSPTLNTLLAKAIVEIIQLKPLGILHVAGERMNRYEFAVKLAEEMNLPKELIEKAKMKDMDWKAKRPRDSSLNISKAKSLLKTNFYETTLALKTLRKEYLTSKRGVMGDASRNNG